MELTLLGTGTLVPEPGRGSTAILVRGSGDTVPVDLGRGALSRMAEAGVDPLALGQFCLTHLHADHTSELVALLFGLRHGRDHLSPVEIVGPPGLRELVERIGVAWPSAAADASVRLREIEAGMVHDSGLRVVAGPVHHGDHAALGYRIEEPATGTSLAFTGDSGPGPRLLDLARGVDLLVAECGDGLAPGRGRHLDVHSLVELVREAAVGRVVVIHVDPRHGRAAVFAALRDQLADRLIEGEDALNISV